MKQIKISFLGLLEAYKSIDEIPIYRIMKKHYELDIKNDPMEADYLIVGPFNPYAYCKYDKIRIMYSGENYIPDLNLVDYSISSYPISLDDRCFRLPVCIDQYGHCSDLQGKRRNYDSEWLKKKSYFANFIAGHESEGNLRGDFFKELEKYKRVESPGRYLNNMENGYTVNWIDSSKVDFQRKCKFTICFESTSHKGFVTEKITDAFFADTIPIYFGSEDITEIFNEDAFICCHGRHDFNRVIRKIIELDQDDDKYLEMMQQPVFKNENYVDSINNSFEKYVRHIFDQPIELASRRSKVYASGYHEKYIRELQNKAKEYDEITLKAFLRQLIRRIKR